MNTLLIIMATIIANAIIYSIYKSYKKRQLKRDEDLFIFKLEQILRSTNITKIQQARILCRNTEGKVAAGVYLALECAGIH